MVDETVLEIHQDVPLGPVDCLETENPRWIGAVLDAVLIGNDCGSQQALMLPGGRVGVMMVTHPQPR
ncbi:MAG: hypothetical protein ACP5I4_15150 [Oceanipulchritudo sp.]